MQAQPSKFSHIYDYIKHGHFYPPGGQHRKPSSSLISEFANSDYSGPDPATESVYQVPPPPRPVTESPTPGVPGAPGAPGAGGIPGNYLDMSGSGTPSPSQVYTFPFTGIHLSLHRYTPSPSQVYTFPFTGIHLLLHRCTPTPS